MRERKYSVYAESCIIAGNALRYAEREKEKLCKPRNRKFSENCGLRRRADKERARLIEKICKAGGDASSPYRLIRIRVSFGLWFQLRVVGCHQEATGKLEREKETAWYGEISVERDKETYRERKRVVQ